MRVRELHLLTAQERYKGYIRPRLYVSRTTTIGQRIFSKGYIPTIASLRRLDSLLALSSPTSAWLTENGPVVAYTFRDRELPELLFEYDELPFDDEPGFPYLGFCPGSVYEKDHDKNCFPVCQDIAIYLDEWRDNRYE